LDKETALNHHSHGFFLQQALYYHNNENNVLFDAASTIATLTCLETSVNAAS